MHKYYKGFHIVFHDSHGTPKSTEQIVTVISALSIDLFAEFHRSFTSTEMSTITVVAGKRARRRKWSRVKPSNAETYKRRNYHRLVAEFEENEAKYFISGW